MRIAPGPPGTATYSSSRPTVSLRRVAMPVRPASAARISGRSRWLSMAGSGPGGKSLSARTRPAASTRVIRRLPWLVASRRTVSPQVVESSDSASRMRTASLSRLRSMSPTRSRRKERSATSSSTATASTSTSRVPATSRVANVT